MERCSLCNKMSVIAEISNDKLCMGCHTDLSESVESVPEDVEETFEAVGKCLNCHKEEVLYKGQICWECYKRAKDDYNKDEIKADFNGLL